MSTPDDTLAPPAAETDAAETDAAGTPDAQLVVAVDLARDAALAAGGDHVGEHLGVRPEPSSEGAHVATHAFATSLPGYVGWHWAVTLGRVDGEDAVTVDEVVLLPGEQALLAPTWVPWDERVQPGDLAPGDLLPARSDDPRLVPAYLLSDDPAVEAVAVELGLGREQVMSREGRLDAAERWFTGDRGPDSPMARQAPAPCGTCGFYLPLAGSLAAGFGVCGNEVTASDGAVVSVEYGCGAHSGVVAEPTRLGETTEIVWDDGDEVTANEVTAADEVTASEVTASEVTVSEVTASEAAADATTADEVTAADSAAVPEAEVPVGDGD